MKIIIAATTDIFFDERVKRIASSLAENHFEVLVIGRKHGSEIVDSTLPFKTFLFSCFFNKGFLFYAEYNVRLFFYLIKHSKKNDIVNACDLDTVLAVSITAACKQNKWTFDAHEYFEEVPELIGRPFVKWIWSLIGKICIPKASLCYTVSESLVQVLGKRYHKDFQLIRNLPRVEKQTINLLPREKILYYQGALNEGRGLELIIEALVHLPSYSFVLAGNGDLDEKLRGLVSRLGLNHRVVFLGRISFEEMHKQASKARIGFNLCKVESLSYYYSLSNKTFEYLQAGLPSIHMDFPEYRKIMREYKVGRLLSTFDLEELIQAVYALENPEEYTLCVEACKKAAGEFLWKNEEVRLVMMYNNFRNQQVDS